MKINQFGAVITALTVATMFDLFGTIKPAAAARLVGLTDNNQLVLFDSSSPSNNTTVSVTGVDGLLLGIDRRPAKNLIYGVTSTNKIYTINELTGAASIVSTLSIPFNGGTVSGVDFNPVPDRLRVVGGNDQNLRINVDTGVIATDVTADGDSPLNPGDPNITAVAYTNVDNDPATGTTLYSIDYIKDALFIQFPPNAGTLGNGTITGAGVPVGSLGIDIDSTAGFDIITDDKGVNTAFAALTPVTTSGSTLYSIDLTTGVATSVGTIGDRRLIGLTTAVPEPSFGFAALFGVGGLIFLRRYRRHVRRIG
ncbi:MAG: DUF4394 domain-containing protein [Desmonostoc vinosum HA7617-LM4]|jgi:hypothetical protein|nr:DUF4394 domain-containing protein [Desmonostoc vinosum HA7617-LM4]